MPEGDTVFHTAETLRKALVGRTLTRCDVRVPRFATVDLTGEVVDEVLSRGKHLFIRVGPASIHSHLKMDGSWRLSTRPPDHARRRYGAESPRGGGTSRLRGRVGHSASTRIILEASGIRAIGIDLGVLEILDRQHDEDAVAHLGPDLLGADWDAQVAAANLTAQPDRPIAEALLDQRVMAGIGNVYCNELCYISGRLPNAPVSSLPDPQRLVRRAREMLWANRSRWDRCTTGDTRSGRQLWVYGRAGQECRRCGTAIEKDSTGDRVAYWCPACQR
ncbi:DNA-formamidopyrimidine glycosylase family protein [Mycobacterium sp.]|uniref:DNA-formamidopyrimidine glycosylase family protein n=1 Tax=Mycobacterium sp. TaxID=1785 RepID=UPI003C74715A